MSYLDELPLSPADKKKLLPLGAKSPAALLGLIQAAPDDFAHFFGATETDQLVARLSETIGEDDRRVLSRPVREFPLQDGIFTDLPAPPQKPPTYDVEERDRLFDHLQRLQADPRPSERTREEIADVEAKLNSMLD